MTLAWAFDTLGYSNRLRDAGVQNNHAEAHAAATRDFVMTELVTKTDLLVAMSDFDARLLATRNDLQAAIEKSALQVTIRLGGIVALGVGLLAALQRIH